MITPDTWFETDDCDPVVIVRHVSFTLTLVARDEDPLTRYQTLDRLTCISLNAIDGSDLGGVCLPGPDKVAPRAIRHDLYTPRAERRSSW